VTGAERVVAWGLAAPEPVRMEQRAGSWRTSPPPTRPSGIAGDDSVYVTVAGEGANHVARYTFATAPGTQRSHVRRINIDRTPPRTWASFRESRPERDAEDILAEQTRWHREPVSLRVAPRTNLFRAGAGLPRREDRARHRRPPGLGQRHGHGSGRNSVTPGRPSR